MRSKGSENVHIRRRVVTVLATAVAAFGIIVYAPFTGGTTHTQADSPWHCGGGVCYDH